MRRPRLKLAPRTKPLPAEGTAPAPPAPAEGGSSIFGAAKPVDTAAKEKEIEEKLAKQKQAEAEKLKEGKEVKEKEADKEGSVTSDKSEGDNG